MRTPTASRLAIRLLATAVLFGVAGCAEYSDLPLPDRPALAQRLASLDRDGAPRRPLGVAQVVRLALDNNPDLRAARAQHAVARAQELQAGLPPNPNLSAAALPLIAGIGTTTAFNVGVTYDLKSLITLDLRRRGAAEVADQVNAQILWQEWQVAGQARLLAIQLIEGERSRRVIDQTRGLLEDRLSASQTSLSAGNTTLAAIAPDFASLQTVRTQSTDIARLQLQRRHQLNALLGLLPDARVPLAGEPVLPPFQPTVIVRALPDLPNRRPDLVALQLGYRAQDDKLRAAILNQFPNLSFGVGGGSDNSNVRNLGPQASLELPVFDRNQGNVAIESATRQQLHDEFAARLASAEGQVRAMLSEMALLRTQVASARRGLGAVRAAADEAIAAQKAGNLDERSYVDLITARLAKEQEVLSLEQALLEQQAGIDTLTGAGLPSVSIDDQP